MCVRIKPLEWRDGRVYFQAQGVGFLGYVTAKDADGYLGAFWYGEKSFETLDQAKAAAQQDYEQRILSALIRPPVNNSPGGEHIVADVSKAAAEATKP